MWCPRSSLGRPSRSPALASDQRFPRFAAAAVYGGLPRCSPSRCARRRLSRCTGALPDTPGALDPARNGRRADLADVAAAYLLNAKDLDEAASPRTT